MLFHVPRQLGGDVGDEVAAGPQTVIVAPHPELAVLRGERHTRDVSLLTLFEPVSAKKPPAPRSFLNVCGRSRLLFSTPPSLACAPPSVCEAPIPKDWAK